MLAALVLPTGCDLRQGNAMKALIFEESGDVDWDAGAFLAARLATRVRVYRFLILTVVASVVYLIVADSCKYLQHT